MNTPPSYEQLLLRVQNLEDEIKRYKQLESERVLLLTEKNFFDLMEDTEEAIGISKGDQFVYTNRALLRLFGYESIDEIARLSISDTVAPESIDVIKQRIRRRESGENVPPQFEYKVIRKDGQVRSIEARTNEMFFNNERFIQSRFRDITDIRRMREQKSAPSQMVFSMLDCLPDPTCVYNHDRLILHANAALVAFLGSEVKGKQLDTVFPFATEIFHTTPFDSFLSRNYNIDDTDFTVIQTQVPSNNNDPLFLALFRHSGILDVAGGDPFIQIVRENTQLYCLAEISKQIGDTDATIESMCTKLIRLMPAAFRFPEEVVIKINIFDLEYCSEEFVPTPWCLHVPIFVKNYLAGHIEVAYQSEKTWLQVGSFLEDEKNFINSLVAIIIKFIERARIDDTLRRNKLRLKSQVNFINTLIDTIPIPIFYQNTKGKFVGCNLAFEKFTGFKKSDIIGNDMYSLLSPEIADIYHRYDDTLIEKKSRQTYDARMRNASNELCDIVFNKSVFRKNDQSVGGLVCMLQDVTKQKEAKKALKENEIRLKLALEASNIGLWDVDFRNGRIFLSPEYSITLGYSPNNYHPDIDQWAQSFCDEDNNIVPLNTSFREIQKKINGTEYRVKAANGEYKWILLKGRVVERDSYSELCRITGTIRDISYQKQAEIALRDSEEKFKSITQSVYDAIILLNHNGAITFWNTSAEKIFGYEKEEIIGHPTTGLLLLNEEQKPEFENFIGSGKLNTLSKNFELEALHKSGKVFPAELSLASVLLKGQHNTIITLRDISERKKADEERMKLENQLRHSQKMETIGTLSGGIAHDFNNILTPIIGYTDMILDELPDENPIREDLEHVRKGAHRAKDLVQQLLTFSRNFDQEQTVVQVHLIIKEVLKLIRASLPTNIEIRQEINTKDAMVLATPSQLHQVIMNLCTNAGYAMRDTDGILEVTLNVVHIGDGNYMTTAQLTEGDYARITVSDTGTGMSAATVERIFEPFFTTKPVGEGTGLGLSVAHGIVTSYGGAIEVYSELGQGTTFHVYLPLTSLEAQEQSPYKQELHKGEARILFVDDEEEITLMAQKMLGRLGYHITISNDSNRALSIFQQAPQNFDLVITDQTMPNLSGDRLVQEIRNIRPEMKIIMITGYSAKISAEKSKDLGVEFLMKPLDISELSRTIIRILSVVKNQNEF